MNNAKLMQISQSFENLRCFLSHFLLRQCTTLLNILLEASIAGILKDDFNLFVVLRDVEAIILDYVLVI
jgi:hypothetical protein